MRLRSCQTVVSQQMDSWWISSVPPTRGDRPSDMKSSATMQTRQHPREIDWDAINVQCSSAMNSDLECHFQCISTQMNFILSLLITNKVTWISELFFLCRQILIFLWTCCWQILLSQWYHCLLIHVHFYSAKVFGIANLWFINCGLFFCNDTEKNNNLMSFYRSPIACTEVIYLQSSCFFSCDFVIVCI